MAGQKQHHYVPRFYLQRFAGASGHVWVFDKVTGRVFRSSPANLAREAGFYVAPELGSDVDQGALERDLSGLEGAAAAVVARWIENLAAAEAFAPLVEQDDRDIMALYLAVQAFRTAEQRAILGDVFAELQPSHLQTTHVSLLATETVREAAAAIWDMIWFIGRNRSGHPFYTSDHPVVIRQHGAGARHHKCQHFFQLHEPDTELLFPLSPTVMLYGYEPKGQFAALKKFDGTVSPVPFAAALVEADNQGQVGHSLRFVFCDRGTSFDPARLFCSERPMICDPSRPRLVSIPRGETGED